MLDQIIGKRIKGMHLEQDGKLLVIELEDGTKLSVYHCIARDYVVVDTDVTEDVTLEWK